jgi:hypothetical protein
MHRRSPVGWIALAAAGCPHPGSPPTPAAEERSFEVDPSPIDPTDAENVARHLALTKDLEPQRAALAADVVGAYLTVNLFAAPHGWAAQAEPASFDRVEVFATPADLWQRLLVLADAPADTPLPAGPPSAGLEGRALVALSPAANRDLTPEFGTLPDAWRRLLAHEMVHRLHVAVLAAQGKPEDAMGPRWFYEGFAVVGSGQDFDTAAHLAYGDSAAALAGVRSTEDPRLAYQRYAAAVRWFARRAPLADLVARAGDPGFEDWLATL